MYYHNVQGLGMQGDAGNFPSGLKTPHPTPV